jgi:ABC-type Zn uptake system ZnuABC Zn-binding protein ZnuA
MQSDATIVKDPPASQNGTLERAKRKYPALFSHNIVRIFLNSKNEYHIVYRDYISIIKESLMRFDTLHRFPAILLLVLMMLITACAAPATEGTPPTTDTTETQPTTDDHAEEGEEIHSDEEEHGHEEGEEHSDEEHLSIPDLGGITLAEGETLRVVATTSIIGDVVRNVVGDNIELTVLMAEGQDPHSYQPTAADLTIASNAHIVFVNGWDLEEGLVGDLEGANESGVIVPISAGIEPLEGEGREEEAHEEEGEHAEGEEEHGHLYDPHVWFDVHNVETWVHNVEAVLSTVDSANAETYAANAEAYEAELEALEQYIQEGVAQIPEANRKLVTNHDTFSYFATAYGFEVIGTILPGASTGNEPSAADLTELIAAVQTAGVQAVFIENTVGEGLAGVLNEETGAQVYELYTDAVGPVGSGAETYIGMIRANIDTLVEALEE